jgi:pyridoxamine 5'-phosphate oxidase family protein
MAFTEVELAYLASQRLGRLATVDDDGAPQNNPVGFRYNPELEAIDIYGFAMGSTRKFRNVGTNPRVALVVDDLASVDPWQVRGIEIRGLAQALADQHTPGEQMSSEIIRIVPVHIIAWGIDPDRPGMRSRRVTPAQADFRVA